MFRFQSKNPIIPLLIGLCFLAVIYGALETMSLMQQNNVDIKKDFKRGNVYFSEQQLAPFMDKFNPLNSREKFEGALQPLLNKLEGAERFEYTGFTSLEAVWADVFASPILYTGILIPKKVVDSKNVSIMSDETKKIIEIEMNQYVLKVYLCNKIPDFKQSDSLYLDLFFMGKHGDAPGEYYGLARELYVQPNRGFLPKMMSDKVAIGEIVDDYKLPKETRKVSTPAFQHFFSKVQQDEHVKIEPLVDVGYGEMMETPERYRGKMVEVQGSLIHYEKRRLSGAHIFPGMEYYFQCYILDSDRLVYIVRCLDSPRSIERMSIVKSKGYFLQRFNFHNRMDKITWAPLIVSSHVEELKEKPYGITSQEKRVIVSFLALVGLVVVYVFFRKPKAYYSRKRLHKKKNIKENIN